MKILVFTEGTILMAGNAMGHTREEIVRQVVEKEESVHDYGKYIPVGNAVKKLITWKRNGANLMYLTSRVKFEEIEQIKDVLSIYNFPEGELFFRQEGEDYKDVAERVVPDILIEDDCESIGGEIEMTYPHIRSDIKINIKSITVKEFGGIDHLPDDLADLTKY